MDNSTTKGGPVHTQYAAVKEPCARKVTCRNRLPTVEFVQSWDAYIEMDKL